MWLPLGLASLVYLNTIGSGFVWDDRHLIVNNSLLRQWSPLAALVSDFWQEGERSDFYRPLVSLSYFLEFRVWRLSPAGYHAANVVYHLAATLAVTWTARLLLGGSVAAGISGVVFALHPIHTESVAFISGRPDVLAGAFVVGAFALFARSRRSGRGAPLGSIALFAAALLCKETALALLPVLIVYEVTLGTRAGGSSLPAPSPSGDLSVRRLVALVWPYLVVAGAYFGLRWIVLGAPIVAGHDRTGLAVRAVTALNALGESLRLLVFPYPPAPHRLADPSLSAQTALALAALALLVVVLAWSWRRTRVPAFLAAWFLLTLLPASPLLPWRTPQVAERFLYVPSVAVAWFLGWGGSRLWTAEWLRNRIARRAAIILAASVVGVAGGLTALRNRDWRDEYHLFSRMAASEPRSHLAALNLGHLHFREGRLALAEAEFRRALDIKPDSPPALLGMALVQSRLGAHDLAIRYGERSRALAPEGDLVHAQLGVIYGLAARYPEAVDSFRESIRRNPRRLHPRANLVVALADQGRHSEAAAALADAERLLAAASYQDPGDAQMLAGLRQRLTRERTRP